MVWRADQTIHRRQALGWLEGEPRVRQADALATQLQLLTEGALSAALVRGDPAIARSARAAAEVLLDAAKKSKK